MAKSDKAVVSIEINQEQLANVEAMLADIKDGSAIALMRALNKTVKGCEVDAAKAVSAVVNLTQARIKKDIGYKTATKLVLSASVYSRGKQVELVEYGARQLKQGVSFQTMKSGGRLTMHYGFLAAGSSTGKLHVMRRTTGKVGSGTPIGAPRAGYLYTFPAKWGDKYKGEPRIKYGPSVPDIMGKTEIFQDIERKAIVRLSANIDHEAEYLIMQKQEKGDGTE